MYISRLDSLECLIFFAVEETHKQRLQAWKFRRHPFSRMYLYPCLWEYVWRETFINIDNKMNDREVMLLQEQQSPPKSPICGQSRTARYSYSYRYVDQKPTTVPINVKTFMVISYDILCHPLPSFYDILGTSGAEEVATPTPTSSSASTAP